LIAVKLFAVAMVWLYSISLAGFESTDPDAVEAGSTPGFAD